MFHVKTNLVPGCIPVVHTEIETAPHNPWSNTPTYKVYMKETTEIKGLTRRYTVSELHDDIDPPFHINSAQNGRGLNGERQCFSQDDQEVLLKYLKEKMEQKEQINIVEIGVNSGNYMVKDKTFETTSTSIFLGNKRLQDKYLGVDIDDKSFLNNHENNIFTMKTPSENVDAVFKYMDEIKMDKIDIFMIDGFHSINQVYKEWKYTDRLASKGIVILHDTNAHPGPYFLMKSIDTNVYDVYKYFNDIADYGIGVAIKKE